jgi:hypothetical protein
MQTQPHNLPDPATLRQAMDELGIRVPVRAWAVERGRLVLRLANGETATWTPPVKRRKPRKTRVTSAGREVQ